MEWLYRITPSRPAMLTDGPTDDEQRIVGEHFAYLSSLTDAGQVELVGRTQNNDASAFGIAIFRADNEAAARAVMAADPAVRAGVMQAELFPYKIALQTRHESTHAAAAFERHFLRPKHGAFSPLINATDGLNAAQAALVPAPGLNSVWAIANHIWFWMVLAQGQLEGRSLSHTELGASDEGGWEYERDFTSDAAWLADRQRMLDATRDFANCVAALTPAGLDSPAHEWPLRRHQVVASMFAHNAYHVGEIVTVRSIAGFAVPDA